MVVTCILCGVMTASVRQDRYTKPSYWLWAPDSSSGRHTSTTWRHVLLDCPCFLPASWIRPVLPGRVPRPAPVTPTASYGLGLGPWTRIIDINALEFLDHEFEIAILLLHWNLGYWTLDSDLLHLQPVTDRFDPPVRRHPDWDVIRTRIRVYDLQYPWRPGVRYPVVGLSAIQSSDFVSRFDDDAGSVHRLTSGESQGQTVGSIQTRHASTGLTQTTCRLYVVFLDPPRVTVSRGSSSLAPFRLLHCLCSTCVTEHNHGLMYIESERNSMRQNC